MEKLNSVNAVYEVMRDQSSLQVLLLLDARREFGNLWAVVRYYLVEYILVHETFSS